MENEDAIKMRVEFITNKIQELNVLKESNENVSNGFKPCESYIQQNEKCERNEIVEELSEEKHIELDTEKGNIELTNEKDGEETIEETDVELIEEVEDTEYPNKEVKEPTYDNEGIELIYENGDSDSVGENDYTDYEKRYIFKEDAEATIENGDTSEKDYSENEKGVDFEEDARLTLENGESPTTDVKAYTEKEKREILKENLQVNEVNVLEYSGKKGIDDVKRAEYEKKGPVVSVECGSDSKISTSSTEKACSSSSGSKSGSRFEDQNSKESLRIPSDALVAKIVRQAEFYFSDFNLLKNNFLLKHVRRNKEGYVSLKLVASFRKIKSLTKDWRVVAYSLETSKLLELNSEKSKIRRIEPIPKIEETSLGKTVVVFNLPFQNPTSEELKEMFSKFGNIVRAEIMSPKSESYNTYYKRCRYQNEEIASTIFGSIEFENFEDAMSAIKDEESHLPKENRMKVVALMSNIQRSKRRNSRFNQYNQYSRRGNERFKPRYEFQNSQMVNGAHFDDYRYARSLVNEKQYRRFYRGGYSKPAHPLGSASEIPDKLFRNNYVSSGEDVRNARSRQLQMSNRMNINRQFMTHQPRYVDGYFGYRETNFEG